jgi:Protein of unknown function (DUF3105)
MVGLMALALVGCSSDSKSAAPTTAVIVGPTLPGADAIKGVLTYTGLTRDHTDDPQTYPQSPPVGGDHAFVWQNCGVYNEPIRNENAVHSLEHGAVWLAYRPDLPADQVAIVAAFAINQSHILVSPYPGLAAGEAVVVTAWGVQLRLDSVTDPRLAQFVAKYQEGPQAPELGVTCSHGTGDPIQ